MRTVSSILLAAVVQITVFLVPHMATAQEAQVGIKILLAPSPGVQLHSINQEDSRRIARVYINCPTLAYVDPETNRVLFVAIDSKYNCKAMKDHFHSRPSVMRVTINTITQTLVGFEPAY